MAQMIQINANTYYTYKALALHKCLVSELTTPFTYSPYEADKRTILAFLYNFILLTKQKCPEVILQCASHGIIRHAKNFC